MHLGSTTLRKVFFIFALIMLGFFIPTNPDFAHILQEIFHLVKGVANHILPSSRPSWLLFHMILATALSEDRRIAQISIWFTPTVEHLLWKLSAVYSQHSTV